MAVQFILGSAGAGKSHKLYTMLTDRAVADVNTEFVAVVPEQYSMESQKEIVSIHPKGGAFNTEVVSFNRLALQVFEEVGIENVTIMDDLGKTLVLRRVLESCRNELKIYARKVSMPGFVDKIKSTISELEQYNIDAAVLEEMIESSENKPSLQHKLKDIETIYTNFHEYIKEKMITQEEILNIFCRYIDKSEKIKNSEYFIDGFTGFTPIQKKVVDLLIKYAKNVTFAFTLPEDEAIFSEVKEQELFNLSKKTIQSLRHSCIENGVELLKDIVVGNVTVEGDSRPYRMRKSGEISHIEANVFRYTESKEYKEECKDVSLHIAGNPAKEARWMAKQIASMMRENNREDDQTQEFRYRDFAVITGDMETYYRYIEEAFNEYNIPAFIDHKRSITSNPFVDAIKAVIEIVETDFSYESVFHYLRLGILEEDTDVIDRFENYVLMSGRRGYKSYTREWDKLYKGMEKEELDAINKSKQHLVENITPVREILKNKERTVKDKVAALYHFILAQNVQRKLEEYAITFEKNGDLSRAKEYRQTYQAIIELFDKVVSMLGDDILSLSEFKAVLESGFECIKVGIIPPAVDSVMVGDIERTRLKDIKKVIFLLGANDGIIPKSNAGGGIISDMERDFLGEYKFSLAPTARENAFIQKFYLYSALTKPSSRLFLSFAKSNAKGEELRKSYLISVIQKMFSQIEIVDEDDNELSKDNIIAPQDAYRYLASALQEYRNGVADDRFNEIYSVIYENEQYREVLLSMVDAAFYQRTDEKLSDLIARKLYEIKDNIGITRVERFAACAYSQFVQNGLKLQQRRHYELAAYDLGNLYHNAIDMFCKEVAKRGIKWAGIDDTTRIELVDYCVKDVVAKYDNDVLSSTARNLYIADRVRNVTDKTVKVLGKHLAIGRFEPKLYEMTVNHGRIDRVDVFETEDKIYVKVIDYKSGNKKFKLEDTYYGLQLQLMVYLNDAISEIKKENPDKEVLPGGAFYYGVKNPYIDKPDFEAEIGRMRGNVDYDAYTDEELKQIIAEECQMSELRMSGLVNGNGEVLEAIDTVAFSERGASKVIPLKYTKSGIDSRASSSVISEEGFKQVVDYAMYKADTLQNQILDGEISLNPYEDSCKYCPYKNVCRFDNALGDNYREKAKYKQEEILAKMEER